VESLKNKILKLTLFILNLYAHPTTFHGAKITLFPFASILEPYENTHPIIILYFDVGLTKSLACHFIVLFGYLQVHNSLLLIC
jgi:hypothetical protein